MQMQLYCVRLFAASALPVGFALAGPDPLYWASFAAFLGPTIWAIAEDAYGEAASRQKFQKKSGFQWRAARD